MKQKEVKTDNSTEIKCAAGEQQRRGEDQFGSPVHFSCLRSNETDHMAVNKIDFQRIYK